MTKKLVTILAEELPEWPEGVEKLHQWSDGEVTGAGFSAGYKTIAPDWCHSNVTRAKWEAERARILAESSKSTEADKAHIAELTAIACGKRSKEDQALWDKAALSAMQSLMTVYWEAQDKYEDSDSLVKCQVESAFEYAEAFMAERAKRLEGKQ